MVNIYKVAEHAGVSRSTVSRYLNGSPNVSDKAKRKIQAAIDELDYHPNAVAQSLARRHSNCIGMVVETLSGPYHSEIIHAVQHELRRLGKHLIVTAGGHSNDETLEAINFLQCRQIDGLLVLTSRLNTEMLLELNGKIKNMVVLGRRIPELESQCIWVDEDLGGRMVARHLLERGYKKLACLRGAEHIPDVNERMAGFLDELSGKGVSLEQGAILNAEMQEQLAYQQALEFLPKFAPDALFCCNDNMAAGAIRAANQLGIKVPEQLAIVGYDDNYYAQLSHPALSTVAQPLNEMGELGAQRVCQEQAEGVMVSPSFVLRESS
ncbi:MULTISPECIES: LacI family DNA-binding transcriptional regulator [Aliagarivorans]|uniref:LacI family DNA-binding transcriptional regulator n=1 Tax=Aliagarivorans TaxID=882379 RepID=UPI00042300B6|nr:MULTISPECIES: LacI family DNA-binding transcriptional regulator [Aliagarivorans]